MRYISTRGQAPPVSFLDAVLAGMAPDGGLYVPESWPSLYDGTPALDPIKVVCGDYGYTANIALGRFMGSGLDVSGVVVVDAYHQVREKWPPAVTPLRQIGSGEWMLELFHGPSLSFKDIAMQLIGPLYDLALEQRDQRLTVVCATSGDTGGAAVEALKGRKRIDLFVLTPQSRVSDVQRRFMTTSGAANVRVIDIDGDFDACQAIVKTLFADRAFADRAHLSGVNSINWARIVAQSVYFHIAAHTLSAGGPVSFVVPTGNFGDAYSGWVAKQCGAPIGRIMLATNENDILARALETGRYQRGMSTATLSPAMDIQVASNFERILFEALDRDADATRRLYETLQQSGGFDIPRPALAKLRTDFSAGSVDDAETLEEMRGFFAESGELVCPHTGVGLAAQYSPFPVPPIVYLATAHPAKFPETVERATGVHPELPPKCADLFQRSEKFDSLPADAEAVKQYIRERSRAWS